MAVQQAMGYLRRLGGNRWLGISARQCFARIPFIKLGDGNAASLAGFVKNGLFSGIIKKSYK